MMILVCSFTIVSNVSSCWAPFSISTSRNEIVKIIVKANSEKKRGTCLGSRLHASNVDVAGAVATGISDLMSQNWAVRLSSEVNAEVVIELHASVLGVHVNH